ncbi:MAG TPA: carboxypeptidase-like regulatory domain-containing protein, partial [Acidobacteriaceae bacterium]|nr:carboxypeptidase-like regulatory domain-containing protein [Acidobacteriaceae bacterium]
MIRNRYFFWPRVASLAPVRRSLRQGLPRGAWLFVVLLLSMVPIGFAQGTGTISGYVHDNSGAAIPGATVTAVMTQQQTTRTQQSNAQGFYDFVALPAGTYTLTFESKGFKREIHSGVELTVSQNVRADAQLSVGAVQTEVNVSSTVPLVDTTSN